MSEYILAVAAIILICLLLSKLSGKMGVPTLILFILLGITFGSDGLLKVPFDNFALSERICTIALVFIIFYGGFCTSWRQARPVAIQATLLASLGVVLTAGLTGLFCHYILGFPFWESMLIGSVISSTDAASVFSILRSKRLALKYGSASMLEVESGSNDPFSYMLTVMVLAIMSGNTDNSYFLVMLIQQICLGLAVGAAVGGLCGWLLRLLQASAQGFDAMLVFSLTLVAYAGADYLGGNGYLSVYIFGIILGNMPIGNKKNLVHFFDGITGLMQILVFFLLGLLSFPSHLGFIFLPALAIALFLTFVARPLAVFTILTPFRCPLKQQLLVSWTGLRGAASIVFAIMATVNPAETHLDVFHITFFIVLFSIFMQGSLIPFMARKLKMIDHDINVMKTFSDYSDEAPLQFIRLTITLGHPWANARISDIPKIPDLLLVMLLRGEEKIIPHGDTCILVGDVIVITAMSVDSEHAFMLNEKVVEKDSPWQGKSLMDTKLALDSLIIAIKRGETLIIPHGSTRLEEGDILISATKP